MRSVLALSVLLLAVAAPLAALEFQEIAVVPAKPFAGDVIKIVVSGFVGTPCFPATLLRSGNTFEYRFTFCPVPPPAGPSALFTVPLTLGPLPVGLYTFRVTFDGSPLIRRDFAVGQAEGTCQPGPEVLCLGARRFQVETTWTANGGSGAGQAADLSDDTGVFSFFQNENVELVTKVLDGCAVNGHFWVFTGGLTNVGVGLKVTDTVTGTERTYTNPAGQAFAPVQDTAAFACP